MVEDLLADLPPVLFLAVCLVRITVQAGWSDRENKETLLWHLIRRRMLALELRSMSIEMFVSDRLCSWCHMHVHVHRIIA